ncbi:MAG: hypothetical protein ACI9YH_000396 [Colwellia sp.]|jgi:hypothetical protein
MKRIHIVGCGPRSGTTLMTEMMIACFDIDLYTTHEDSLYTPPTKDAKIFLTKNPKDTLIVEPALKILSNLTVIYLVRDPRDMIISKHSKDPDRYWGGLKFWKTYTPYGRRLKEHPRFLTVKYEDLVNDPDSVQEKLQQSMQFLNKKASFSLYHEVAKPSVAAMEALRGVRPVSKASVGGWRKHLPRIVGQIQLHGSITDDLIEFGYEKNSRWESELEGVETNLNKSHHSEYFLQEEIKRLKQGRYIRPLKMMIKNNKFFRHFFKGA